VFTKSYPLNNWNSPYLIFRWRYIRRLPDREERTHSTSTEEHDTSDGTGRCQQSCGIPSLTSTHSVLLYRLSNPTDPKQRHPAKSSQKQSRLTNHLSVW